MWVLGNPLTAQARSDPQAQFSTGKWSGKWIGEGQTEEVLAATLQIDSISNVDGKMIAVGVSTWGDAPEWNMKADSLLFKRAEVTKNVLAIGPNAPIVLTFTLQLDGSIYGARTEKGKPAGTIKMVREPSAK